MRGPIRTDSGRVVDRMFCTLFVIVPKH